jgi:hypothetical protein
MQSPELETRDQLLGGELSLTAIQSVYPNTAAFLRGILGLLSSGDVCLMKTDKTEVPDWQ